MQIFTNKKNIKHNILHHENGRSMVEMLGVLAIIGVLSVGAIAGYSKAMMKHKFNKQSAQISYILDYLILNYTTNLKLENHSEFHLGPLLRKLGIISQDMIKQTDKTYSYDVFGTKIGIENHRATDGGGIALGLYITDSQLSVEICRNIFIGKPFFVFYLNTSSSLCNIFFFKVLFSLYKFFQGSLQERVSGKRC